MVTTFVRRHSRSLGAVSAAALLALVPVAASAQQMPSSQSGQQTQATQPQAGLSGHIAAVEQARQSIDNSQPTQMQTASKQALDAVRALETSLSQLKDRAGQAVQAAMQRIESAKNALDRPQPVKATASQALAGVVEDARRVEQQVAQNGTTGGSGTRVGVEQRSAQVQVQQKAPNVTVQQPQPKVTVQQPQPTVTVQQPQPTVTVQQPQPQVTVQQPRPQVTVEQAKPEVNVQQQGQPQVTVQRQGQPQVDVQRPQDQTAQSRETATSTDRTPTGSSTNAAGSTQQPATVATPGTTAGAGSQVAVLGRSIVGKEIYGADNGDIGEVENVVMQGTQVRSVLVDVGGFLGIGERRVSIPVDQLRMEGDRVVTSMTKEQVRNLPEYRGPSQ
ncbi:MAG: PRC-barrel domain-containing protein [Hyphomicrobiaceae bacterium]